MSETIERLREAKDAVAAANRDVDAALQAQQAVEQEWLIWKAQQEIDEYDKTREKGDYLERGRLKAEQAMAFQLRLNEAVRAVNIARVAEIRASLEYDFQKHATGGAFWDQLYSAHADKIVGAIAKETA